MDIIATEQPISKVRPNLFQLPTGQVIGFGAILAPGGLYYCFTCNGPECQHVQAVEEDWLAGRHSVESPQGGLAKPDNAIPAAWWTVSDGIDDFSVDRETGEVTL